MYSHPKNRFLILLNVTTEDGRKRKLEKTARRIEGENRV